MIPDEIKLVAMNCS